MANATSLNTESNLPCRRISQRAFSKSKDTWASDFNSFVFSAHIASKLILAFRQLKGGHLPFLIRAEKKSRHLTRLAFSVTTRQFVNCFDLAFDGDSHNSLIANKSMDFP